MNLFELIYKMIDDYMLNKKMRYYMIYNKHEYEIEPIFLKADDIDRDCKTDYIVQSIVINNYQSIISYFGLSECLYNARYMVEYDE